MKTLSRKIIALCLLLMMVIVNMLGSAQSGVTATGSAGDQLVQSALDLKHTLRFGSDGKFKIVIFSDIQDTYPLKSDTVTYMNKILDQEKPDLVLLGGDNHCGNAGSVGSESKMKTYLNAMAKPMEDRKIPWAQVYGNHANGGYNYNMGFGPESQQKLFESFKYNISKKGTVHGVGNYVLPILRSDSQKIAFNVFMMDSHNYVYQYRSDAEKLWLLETTNMDNKTKGTTIYSGNTYDVIHMDQIKWYWDTSVALEKYNGSKIAAMMLFHIPLYEWNYVLKNKDVAGMTGKQGEPVCAPEANSGLFQACYERGDVKALICGHDHINDFAGTYMGITMAYTPTIGSLAYYDENNRGARTIEIDQNDPFNFKVGIVYTKDLK